MADLWAYWVLASPKSTNEKAGSTSRITSTYQIVNLLALDTLKSINQGAGSNNRSISTNQVVRLGQRRAVIFCSQQLPMRADTIVPAVSMTN